MGWKIVAGIRVFLLLILLALFVAPLVKQPSNTLRNIGLQQTRCERIAKDALILEYRPATERAQAIGELQALLQNWQSEQVQILTLPDSQIQTLALQSNVDYSQMTAALQRLLVAPAQPVDPVQVSIILANASGYTSFLGQIATVELNLVNAQYTQFFVIALVALVALVVLTVVSRHAQKVQPPISQTRGKK